MSVDGKCGQTADEATDIGSQESVWAAPVQQVSRQTSHVQRAEHCEYVTSLVDVRYQQTGRRADVIDAHVESFVSASKQVSRPK